MNDAATPRTEIKLNYWECRCGIIHEIEQRMCRHCGDKSPTDCKGVEFTPLALAKEIQRLQKLEIERLERDLSTTLARIAELEKRPTVENVYEYAEWLSNVDGETGFSLDFPDCVRDEKVGFAAWLNQQRGKG